MIVRRLEPGTPETIVIAAHMQRKHAPGIQKSRKCGQILGRHQVEIGVEIHSQSLCRFAESGFGGFHAPIQQTPGSEPGCGGQEPRDRTADAPAEP